MFKTLMISVWLFYLITNLINKFLKLMARRVFITHAQHMRLRHSESIETISFKKQEQFINNGLIHFLMIEYFI